MATVAISEFSDSGYGHSTAQIEGAEYSWAHAGWHDPVLKAEGVTYLVVDIFDTLQRSKGGCYTPGAVRLLKGRSRKTYVPVTIELLDEWIKAHNDDDFTRSNSRERNQEIRDFCYALAVLM